jgi:hypothetical protein
MSKLENIRGSCLCGAITKWCGGPSMSFDAGTAVEITGGQFITRYDSSEWAIRGFCSHCGTHVLYMLKDIGEYILPVGLFDDENRFDFENQIFIDKKPAYYHFGNSTTDLTAEEVYAQFAS